MIALVVVASQAAHRTARSTTSRLTHPLGLIVPGRSVLQPLRDVPILFAALLPTGGAEA